MILVKKCASGTGVIFIMGIYLAAHQSKMYQKEQNSCGRYKSGLTYVGILFRDAFGGEQYNQLLSILEEKVNKPDAKAETELLILILHARTSGVVINLLNILLRCGTKPYEWGTQ